MTTKLYPLTFYPILKERIWGGTKLKSLGKDLAASKVGESWEISTVEKDISVISNGRFKGTTLLDLIKNYPEQILGKSVYNQFGNRFPLLFKFLDAREDLSIQVHPNDELAKKRHNSFGKTEMWYVMQAETDSRIIVGFSEPSSPQSYLEHLKNGKLPQILDQINVRSGDMFFLETGTIHAIGAGILIAEIQQTSDVTYRVYDWDRGDEQGKTRELHIEEALEAINYDVVSAKLHYDKKINTANLAVKCPYFTTNYIPLDGSMDIQRSGNSFSVYMCVEGTFTLETSSGKFDYKKGDSVLVPAIISDYSIMGKATILEIYI